MSLLVHTAHRLAGSILSLGEDFKWQRGVTPLSSPIWPLAGMVCYLLLIAVGKATVRQAWPVPRSISAAHNLVLCIGSALMFAGCLSALFEVCVARRSVDVIFCTPPGTRPAGRLFFWSYVYYLSKYYELADTLLLVVKRKHTSLLHVFHHALVIFMAWLWVDQAQSLQFGGLLTNTAVHVVMYYYYFLTTLAISPWWKRSITTFQIVQFLGSFATLPVFAAYQWRLRAREGGCAGLAALAFNAAFNLCLLVLFAQFYTSTYNARKKKAAAARGAAVKAD